MFNGKWLILLALVGCIAANADKRYAAVECTDAGEQKLLELYRIRSEIKTRKNLFALFSPIRRLTVIETPFETVCIQNFHPFLLEIKNKFVILQHDLSKNAKRFE